jgi:hypothetical protein
MRQLLPTQQLIVEALSLVAVGRYSIISAYAICFYDWITSLDQEVALIYPAPWNIVKAAYLFCRCYPMAVAPFHLWGLIGDHEQHTCEPYYHLLYFCAMPTMLSAQFILMLRTYAFSGRKKPVLAVLSIAFFALVGAIIWVVSKELSRLSPRYCSPRYIPDCSVESQCRPYSCSSIVPAVSPSQIYRLRLSYWRLR